MNDELNLFIFVLIVCCVICLICIIGHEIYLATIYSKTTSHIENGIIIDKKEEVNQVPIIIENNIIFNCNIEKYLIVKCNDSTYKIEEDSDEYDIGDEVQLKIKEYKNKVVSFSII
ncbi:hypothetical protein I9Y31_003096 [Clostridium perfringens]|nr:hypothetical protein [Clostridium perfringens]